MAICSTKYLDLYMKILIGSYTDFDSLAHKPLGCEGRGIYIYNYDSDKNIINNIQTIRDTNPAVFKIHQNKLYVLNETIHKNGTINIYNFEDINNITREYSLECSGKSTCSVDIRGKYKVATNYWDGKIDLFKEDVIIDTVNLNIDNLKEPLSREDHLSNRQSGSHPHCVKFWRDRIIVSDLGTDTMYQFKIENDKLIKSYYTKFRKKENSSSHIFDGIGPRHFVIKESNNLSENDLMYLINELNSTIYVLELKLNKIKIIQEISLLNDNQELASETNIHASEIKIYKNYIFASNRSENTIVIFKINENGLVSKVKVLETKGETPRHFDIYQDNLIIANQNSNNVVIFKMEFLNDGLVHIRYNLNITVNSPNFVKIIE